MHWIIQSDLYHEENIGDLIHTLERFAIPYDIVDVPAGCQDIGIDPTGWVFPIGSYSLLTIADNKGWFPGSLWNESHGQEASRAAYGDMLLNHDATIVSFEHMLPTHDLMFVRPVADNKSFDGQVLSRDTILQWKHAQISGLPSPVRCSARVTAQFMVALAPVKEVLRESRHFVVDSRVVTSSTYRLAGKPASQPWVDPGEIEFAQHMASLWGPARAYALDVALTPDGHRIVETNCINSSGLYTADVQRLVMALETVEW